MSSTPNANTGGPSATSGAAGAAPRRQPNLLASVRSYPAPPPPPEAGASSSSGTRAARPQQNTNAPSGPGIAPGGNGPAGAAPNPKKRSWVSNYYEYNFTEMQDSRAGFLVNEGGDDDASAARLAAEAERAAKRQRRVYNDAPVPLDPDFAPKCVECSSLDLDKRYVEHFDVNVCWACKEKLPEKYALLTKTEARQDYLLTEEELTVVGNFKAWRKPNPRKNTYHDMYLYLRGEIEKYAIEKWGSLDAMDAEYARREDDKVKRKEAKFKKKLAQLRNATRTSLWAEQEEAHVHVFKPAEDKEGFDVCEGCGMQVEVNIIEL
ncbi:DNA repair protein rad14 [Blastocladiella emersonii ATCC 22665]|nr:DNA repair protein rad14 [Blastocladiella emersonii ATCC 22665]